MSGTASDSDELRFLFRFGTAEFDQSRFELKVDGAVVDADRRPLELLNLLLIHLGEVITRDELYETLWAEEDVGEGAIANAVSRLRKHLGKDNAAFIVTRPRVGYSFVGKVERIGQNQPLQSAVSLQPGDPVPGRADYQLETLMSVSGNQNREVWKARSVQGDTRHVFKFARQAEGLRQLKREYTVSELLSKVPGTQNAVAIVCGRNFEQPPFYVEYPYLGPDLLKWAEEGDRLKSMNRDERITLFLQVADTVSAAHNLGVLHKDIKPANVLIKASDNGYKAVLTDFGSSHLMQSQVLVEHGVSPLGMSVTFDTSPTTTGGTLLYLAPEVWAGESPSIRSDIYALGIMLYQMLSGDLRQGIPPDWRERLNDELLAEDIQAATSSDVSERLPSVAELSERLRSLNERRHKAEVAAQKEAEILAAKDALSRARTRRPWLIAASLSLITGLVVSLTLYQQAENARKEAETQVARTETINQFWQDEIIQSGNPYAKDQASITDVLQSASAKAAEVFKDDPATAGSIYESLAIAFTGISEFDQSDLAWKRAINAYNESNVHQSLDIWTAELRYAAFLSKNRGEYATAIEILENFNTHASYEYKKNTQIGFWRSYAEALIDSKNNNWDQDIKNYYILIRQGQNANIDRRILIDPTLQLAKRLSRRGRNDESEKLITDILEGLENISRHQRIEINVVKSEILFNLQNFKESIRLLSDIQHDLIEIRGEESETHLKIINLLANSHSNLNDPEKALFYAKESTTLSEKILPQGNQNRLIAKIVYGVMLLSNDKFSDSIEIFSKAKTEITESTDTESPLTDVLNFNMSMALIGIKEYEKSRLLANSINLEKFQSIQPNRDVTQMVSILTSILDYRQHDDTQKWVFLKSELPNIESCECTLYHLAKAAVESNKHTIAEGD